MAVQGDNFSALVNFKLKEGKSYENDVVPILKKFVQATSKEEAMHFYGFARSTSDPSVFVCREHYTNAEGFLTHLANVGECLKEVGDHADITMILFVGTEEDVNNEKLREATKDLPTTFLALDHKC